MALPRTPGGGRVLARRELHFWNGVEERPGQIKHLPGEALVRAGRYSGSRISRATGPDLVRSGRVLVNGVRAVPTSVP